MKISYNWLKWYVPDLVEAGKLANVFNYHLCEVESVEHRVFNSTEDWIFDLKILPNRAHDLLSHQGVAHELASLLDIKYVDPTPKYKIPESKPTKLEIKINTDKCRRYMGRVVKNVKVRPSPDWVVEHLASIGQRSINNVVDAVNLVMFDCGQPIHAFDLDKMKDEKVIIRESKKDEKIITLDGKELSLTTTNLTIADSATVLAIAGIKGGKVAEVDNNTKNIILEVANFDSVSIRKTAQALNIFTDARKRFENDLSPELVSYAMRELSALILEMCPEVVFEDIVDIYPQTQKERRFSFSADRISNILGLTISKDEIRDILRRYNFVYKENTGKFEIVAPSMRLDLVIEEDIAEEIGRIIGYDKIKGNIPKINFKSKVNETYGKISWARNKLLNDGYSEVMTYVFKDKGEVEVQKSASDKKFLRTNLTDGLQESIKLNQLNAPFLGIEKVKVFEIGTVFKKNQEQINVCFGDKKKVIEISLDDFSKSVEPDAFTQVFGSPVQDSKNERVQPDHSQKHTGSTFHMWSIFPFIARDIAVWVPKDVKSLEVKKIIKDNAGNMVIKGPELFDEFKKGDQISYAFRIIFQSYDRTLTDVEVNEVMDKITNKIKENKNWQVR